MAEFKRQLRKRLMAEQDGLCVYCDTPMTTLNGPCLATIDHVVPLAKGGGEGAGNCVLACHQCNRLKGCMTPNQMRTLADRVERLGGGR